MGNKMGDMLTQFQKVCTMVEAMERDKKIIEEHLTDENKVLLEHLEYYLNLMKGEEQ